MAKRITCETIYRRMGKALKEGKGVRLSFDELEHLFFMDDAIGTIITNIRDGLDARDGTEVDG